MLGLLRKFDFFRALFGGVPSATQAKERLRIVLIQDQSSISSELLNVLRHEMIGVVSRYLEIDLPHLEMGIERKNGTILLAANIPILRLRKEGRALVPDSLEKEETASSLTPPKHDKSSETSSDSVEVKGVKDKEPVAVEVSKNSANSSKPERRQRRGRRHLR